jgi:hypothetical protein
VSITATATVAAAGAAADPYTAFEDTIQRWVVSGSGLASDHVLWAADATGSGPIPAGTYISMRLVQTDTVSDDWLISRRVGDNVEHHVRGTRHPKLDLTCFAGARYGSGRAAEVLGRVTGSILLPSVATILRKGQVGVGLVGSVRTVDGMRSQMFDPRATVRIELHTMFDIFEVGREFRSAQVTTPGAPEVTVEAP